VRLSGEGTTRAATDAGLSHALLTTEDAEFLQSPSPIRVLAASATVEFDRPGAIVLSAVNPITNTLSGGRR
jgi:hypothetical protein